MKAACARENRSCFDPCNELTQPQGHSSSGSHERYKDANRLAGKRFRCILNETMDRRHQHCLSQEIDAIDANAKKVLEAKAWNAFIELLLKNKNNLLDC
jgi:hypothetical protein